MKKPSAYEIATHKGRQADEARSPDYCGSCSIEVHCTQVRDPKSWVHSSIKRWEELGGWGEEENSEAKDSLKSGYETVASVMAERDALRAQVEVIQADSDLYRQWFNAVQDLNPRYLEQKDYQAAVRLLERLNIRVPLSVVAGASKL